jgi:Protein of unknown function (DUF3078)
MRKLLFSLLAITIAFTVAAQDKAAKTKKTKKTKPPTAWKAGGSISILGGGGSSKDHYSGLNSETGFVYGGYLKLYADKNWGRNVWTNSLMGGYLRTTADDNEPELNENKIELNIRYGYKLKNEKWQPGVMFNARTQIVNGYDYSYATPKRTSGFFAPAFITISAGTNLQLCKSLDMFVGPAVRWVTVTNRPYSLNYQGGIKPDGSAEPTLASYYNVDPEKQVRYETGALVNLSWKKEFAKKVTIKSRLQLISDFREQPDNIDIFWTTGIGVNLGKWFTIAGNFDLIYDEDIRKSVMYRGFAGVGAICRF